MDHQLEIFLRAKGYHNKFKPFIKTKTDITAMPATETIENRKSDEQTIRYKFKGELPQIISAFLRNDANKTFIKKFERNEPAEKNYMKLIPQRSFLHKGRTQGKYKARDNTKDIENIFKSIFGEDTHKASIVKQYIGRYQHIIEKEYFTEEQIETINIGVFFLMIIYYIAKQEKITTQSSAEKSEPKDSPTKKTELDSVLNKPQYVKFNYVPIKGLAESVRDRNKYLDILSNYLGNDEILQYYFEKLSPEQQQNFSEWLKDDENKKMVKNIPQFNESIQEGTHSVLYNRNTDNYDLFTDFLFDVPRNLEKLAYYTYFFKGSTKKELVINGIKTDIIVYAKPDDAGAQSDLNSDLKPIWFRDITNNTKETKRYTKLSMEEAHKTAKSYENLFYDKIIKFIEITYQCKENGIYVSFKTNNFEIPPIVLNEKKFKEVYTKHPNRVLYRGLNSDQFERQAHTLFKKLKEKGVSYNITKHNNQFFGPGVYWTKDIGQAKKYGDIIVMGLTISDFSTVPEDFLYGTDKGYQNMFLMSDNQCIVIREKAVSTVPSSKLSEELKREYEKYDIVVLDTEKEIEKWLQCKD